MTRFVNTSFFMLILCSSTLFGCGQKGPLYMEPTPVADEASATPAADKPCPTERCTTSPAHTDQTEH